MSLIGQLPIKQHNIMLALPATIVRVFLRARTGLSAIQGLRKRSVKRLEKVASNINKVAQTHPKKRVFIPS